MEPNAQRDPEFATSISDTANSMPVELEPELYLRIVANPFLALAASILWLMALSGWGGMLRRSPELIGPLTPIVGILFLASLFLLPGLLHYHCLDCGATGRLSRWRTHTCATFTFRRLMEQPRRFRGPRPFVQVLLWIWGLLFLGVFLDGLGLRLWRR